MKERGFTLIELLIVVAIIGIVAAIAVPSMLRGRAASNEASAIASIRVINSAQTGYASSAARGGYAVLLETLGTACSGSSAAFLSPDLSFDPVIKSGYRFTLGPAASAGAGPSDCNGTPTRSNYYLTSVPISAGTSGQRAFALTAAGATYFDVTGVAPTEAAMAPGGGALVIQ